MGTTFHLALGIVSLQANVTFHTGGNGYDISFHLAFRIVSLQANVTFHTGGNGYDISSGLWNSFTAG